MHPVLEAAAVRAHRDLSSFCSYFDLHLEPWYGRASLKAWVALALALAPKCLAALRSRCETEALLLLLVIQVVLAASVLAKSGKVLVSRQFVEMTRIRVEGLLAAFPKLVGMGKQHTYVETENVRYVYQPMEGIYLVLVTNKQSNILEDLETLRMLAKVCTSCTACMYC